MMKQSTPEISRMHMQSPEQSRIASNAGDKFKLETTPVSGFSSIHEKSFAPNMTQPPRRFILSPGLFSDASPNVTAVSTSPNLNSFVQTKFELSSTSVFNNENFSNGNASKTYNSSCFDLTGKKFDLSSPKICGGSWNGNGNADKTPILTSYDLTGKKSNFVNTPAGRRLHKRLNDLMTTLRSSEEEINESDLLVKNDSISSEPSDSLLLTTQPDFSGIDF